jgi:hypothetical protein
VRAKEQDLSRQSKIPDPQSALHYFCQSPDMPYYGIEFIQSNPGFDALCTTGIAEAAQ